MTKTKTKEEEQIELELEKNDKTAEAETETDKKADAEDEAQKKIKELQDQMAKFDADRKLAVERADRLEKEKAEANAKAAEAQGKANLTQKEALSHALEASTRALEFNRKQLKDALEAGDSEKVVEYQEKLAESTYINSDLKNKKFQYEQWEKRQEEEAKRPKPVQLPPAVQQWIDRNPKYNTDPVFKAEADSAHDAAVRRGYQFGSPAYLEFIDQRIDKVLGEKEVVTEKKKVIDSEDDEEPTKAFAAPVGRGGGEGSGGADKKKIKLSAQQLEAAEFMGMTPVEYAKYLHGGK